MKILIFGIGNYYQTRKKMIPPEVTIVGYLDNYAKVKYVDGKKVYLPIEAKRLEFTYIVLMSLMSYDMRKQLISIGIDEKKIKLYEEFIQLVYNNLMTWYHAKSQKKKTRKILIAYAELTQDGGSMTAIRTAEALTETYSVDFAITNGEEKLVRELNGNGINVVIFPALNTINMEENKWLNEYDLIIANTVKMMPFVDEISKCTKVLIWLHDPISAVERMEKNFNPSLKASDNIKIVAVSDIAKKNFESVFGKKYPISILKYGVPDRLQYSEKIQNKKIIFALIGWVSPIKGQDILLDAISYFSIDERKQFEVWFVGNWDNSSSFCEKLKSDAEKYDNIRILGVLDRTEMDRFYSEVDVVVSASRQDMLPIVLVEGMMHEKLCITSDVTGIASYLTQGVDGLVFRSEDVEDLVSKMRWVLNNRQEAKLMGERARNLYLKEFSMGRFTSELVEIVESMIQE